MPIQTYKSQVQHPHQFPTMTIQYPDGRTTEIGNFSKFVKSNFTNVID
ncbi:MAG: hypothetical protein HOD60_02225 [Candidatus Nitrosopelagicus sp.]|nr:hypothetical protein [Candidatus Nitrosopelagicus sp.]